MQGPSYHKWWNISSLVFYSPRRHRLITIGIPIIKLRWSSDRLRFIMGVPIPVWRCLLVNRGPAGSAIALCKFGYQSTVWRISHCKSRSSPGNTYQPVAKFWKKSLIGTIFAQIYHHCYHKSLADGANVCPQKVGDYCRHFDSFAKLSGLLFWRAYIWRHLVTNAYSCLCK